MRNIYGWYIGAGSIGILIVFCCVFWMAGSTRRRREQAFLAMEQEYYEKVRTGSDVGAAENFFPDMAAVGSSGGSGLMTKSGTDTEVSEWVVLNRC